MGGFFYNPVVVISEGEITNTAVNGDILFYTQDPAVLRMRINNTGEPTVDIFGDLNLQAGSQYYINGVPIGAGVTFYDQEIPTGPVDGSNTTFTLLNTPLSNSEYVYVSGQLVHPGATNDYTIAGATITFNWAPTGVVRVSYRL
jgi:hypothetical protein